MPREKGQSGRRTRTSSGPIGTRTGACRKRARELEIVASQRAQLLNEKDEEPALVRETLTKCLFRNRDLVSVRKHFESFESFVIQRGDLIREGHHRCGRRRTADVTTAANCDIRVT